MTDAAEGSLQQLRARVHRNLAGFERNTGARGTRHAAAVAAVLGGDADGRPCFVITRRAAALRNHSGQWALPGGRLDPGETPAEAALRELEEEVGLARPAEAVLGLLDDYPTRSGFVITPVVVWGGDTLIPEPDPREVEAAYCVPVADLDAPDVPVLSRIPESDRPVLSVPLLGTLIHAPTAAILYQLREVAIHGRDTRVAHYEQPVFAWK